ncbi:proline--tRNA ligase [Heliophilum fasciatum]|uniref:Proline--tRNA ligase n=1 Tax=Heliophilum fasciatum TaxID=35700 RepID=A0A4R2RNF4_9FIRM|nr:proline--tRNA ligase [Heliophilum fasciatum]MCW2277902.1 prolyl-tRNA synthetase [Heliophilum fasciatum]TCP64528.1 prolyl-tRNA synthetase [Heliophilum fasciatum]
MRMSQLLMPTLRETPAEAEIVSHQLLLRAGYIRRSSAGIYHYLPLAHRVLQKIMAIVREEMNKAGGQEILMPIVQPAELWQESGRWQVYGDELFRLKDRHDRDFCLSPTHEEIVTDLVRSTVRSYRDLPLSVYQIANKYRDERRPRFGLMRGREFIMKDQYSFDRDEAGLDQAYQTMYEAYKRVFTRCGLTFRPVEADAGAIGGAGGTHEFMVLAESGEASLVYCDACDYAANVEKAECQAPALAENVTEFPLEKKSTPGQKTIEQVAAFLAVAPATTIKTLVYRADDQLVMVLVRGDRELNEIKLGNLLGCLELRMATDVECQEAQLGPVGFLGPIGVQAVSIYADQEVMALTDAVVGANETDMHWVHVLPGRDFSVTAVADLRMIEVGEPCPACGAPLQAARGIEVGQVFKLGTKYSKALGCTYLDEKGQENPMVMGCYGIGVSRTMAATVEQNYDEHGIIWPLAIAPFGVVVVPVSNKDEGQMAAAQEIYEQLKLSGWDVLLDDRAERPGVKFKDADLIGIPLRVTVGNKLASDGVVELKVRKTGEQFLLQREEVLSKINALRQQLAPTE